MTMKVAEGDVDASGDTTVMAVNNSELTGIDLTFGTSGLTAGATATLQLGGADGRVRCKWRFYCSFSYWQLSK